MVGVGAGAGAGAGAGFGVGAASVGVGAAAFTVNTGENCGGPVFFDGFVFCRAFLPVAWSFASRSRRAGEPVMFEVGGMVSNVSCLLGLPEARYALFWCRSKSESSS